MSGEASFYFWICVIVCAITLLRLLHCILDPAKPQETSILAKTILVILYGGSAIAIYLEGAP